jgi:hypothetical protein
MNMNLEDFTTTEQKQINAGLSTAEITDKEAADKILALVPQDWIKKIPFFVRKHARRKPSSGSRISILICTMSQRSRENYRRRNAKSFAVSSPVFSKRRWISTTSSDGNIQRASSGTCGYRLRRAVSERRR